MAVAAKQQGPTNCGRKGQPDTSNKSATVWHSGEPDDLHLRARQVTARTFGRQVLDENCLRILSSARVTGRSVRRAALPDTPGPEQRVTVVEQGRSVQFDHAEWAGTDTLQAGDDAIKDLSQAPFGLRRAIANPRCRNDQSIEAFIIVRVIRGEEDMLMRTRGGALAIRFVAGKESRHVAIHVASKRHQRAPDRMQKGRSIIYRYRGFRRDREDHEVAPSVRERLHETKAEIPSVTDDQRPAHRLSECDLDMPQALLRKPRPISERLDTRSSAVERLALHSNAW